MDARGGAGQEERPQPPRDLVPRRRTASAPDAYQVLSDTPVERAPGDPTYAGAMREYAGAASATGRSRFEPRSSWTTRRASTYTVPSIEDPFLRLWAPGTGARSDRLNAAADAAGFEQGTVEAGWPAPVLFSKRRDPLLARRYAFAGMLAPRQC